MPPQLEPDNCGNYVVQDSTTKNDIRDNRVKNELNRVKDELEPTTKNCESCRYYGSHHEVCNYCYKCSLWTEQNPTIKNDLAVDCISRKSVITIIQNHWWNCRDIDKLVNDLPSVTPQEPRWIPVSERLPKDGGDYLVTLSLYVGGKEPVREVRKDFYCILSKKWLYNNDDVTAWMPLPQPYKAEREKT